MNRHLLFIALISCAFGANAQNVLIKNATVHTASSQGTLKNTDVLVQGGIIRAVGKQLTAPAGTSSFDAQGRPLTPGLFAGITAIGLEEVSAEDSTVDSTLNIKTGESGLIENLRPEFDVTIAYNPRSTLLAVARVGGLSYTALGTSGALLSGQGSVMRLDGGYEPVANRRIPYVVIGSSKLEQSGSTRAAQFMLLEQAFNEARLPTAGDERLLTSKGRAALSQEMLNSRFFVSVNREADIRQVLKLAQKFNIRIALVGASEAWRLADQIAASKTPVFIDALDVLPGSFEQLGNSDDNAARLQRAGVSVSFINGGDSHNARKIRQVAGNAVANGLSWEAGLAGITSAPAKALGVDAQIGSIEVGKMADLVLWTADPLDVASTAQAMWLAGKSIPMVSRQTLLRDRYLAPSNGLPRAYQQ
ncbi:MAG: amidohydrolase family protein [Arenimonas sp.]|nr:amidohydrolase family protein [Arenimonas sp.]MBP6310117.1 amidohydrolase family protein [Arenimonas sp.]